LKPRANQASSESYHPRRGYKLSRLRPRSQSGIQTPNDSQKETDARHIGVTISHRLGAYLDQANRGHERPKEPKPPHDQIGLPSGPQDAPDRNQRQEDRSDPGTSQIPGIGVDGGQIRGPKQLAD